MSFYNEYVPTPSEEKANFFLKAIKILRLENSVQSIWTVDRENNMVLYRSGTARDPSPIQEDFWTFIDTNGIYEFDTDRLLLEKITPDELAITYRLKRFWSGDGRSTPNNDSLICIKAALKEHKDWGVLSNYRSCQLTLINGTTDKEIQ